MVESKFAVGDKIDKLPSWARAYIAHLQQVERRLAELRDGQPDSRIAVVNWNRHEGVYERYRVPGRAIEVMPNPANPDSVIEVSLSDHSIIAAKPSKSVLIRASNTVAFRPASSNTLEAWDEE